MYQPRTYRNWIRNQDLVAFRVVVKETDLHIQAESNLQSKALRIVEKYRGILERYIANRPLFLTTLQPIDIEADAPKIVKLMAESSKVANVGPMASVAGAIAELVGTELLEFSNEVIIENGGDIFIKSRKKRTVGIFAGSSPLSGKLGFEVDSRTAPRGVSTSSGTVGHSLSLGKADAVVALAQSAALSDAAATALGNLIGTPGDIPRAIEAARKIPGLLGAIIIKGDQIGIWGDMQIQPTSLRE